MTTENDRSMNWLQHPRKDLPKARKGQRNADGWKQLPLPFTDEVPAPEADKERMNEDR